MKIASWNINSLRRRQEQLMSWLDSTGPDVACLQETKCPDDQFPELALRSAGYYSAFHGEKSYNGVAILSRIEMQQVRSTLCDEEIDPQARVISATISGVRIYSIYAPNGQAVGSPAYDYKLKWYQRLRDCLKREQALAGNSDLVVSGDFNVAPEDIDTHDPALWRGAIMCSDGERAAFQDLCRVGLVDTLRLHHREPGMFTWWDYRMLAFPKNRGLRIDAVLASESMSKRCIAAGIDRDVRKGREPSDHAPIWAEFSDRSN
jgi:exodeoxyribonuclease III